MNLNSYNMVVCDPGVPHFNNTCQNLRCFYIYGAIVPFFGLFGLAGNGLSIYVLLQRRMRSFINLLLAGLCGYDCILLISAFIVYVTLAHCECLESMCATMVSVLPIFFPLSQVGHTGSIYRLPSKYCSLGTHSLLFMQLSFFFHIFIFFQLRTTI